ncbi:MAG: DUF2318 domain-containing protein [Clostridia bacterium]|nr:DUF2318 domain-containing protein [Clostridia bacterium]
MANTKKIKKSIFVILGVAVIFVTGLAACSGSSNEKESTSASGGDLVITKSEISETAKFYPYKVGKTNMEVVALKASDGTIRTALNTCQVCYDSGRGYYVQEGSELVCQNCGNRFGVDDVEVVRGGCNPVPVMKENKTEDASTITISKEFLEQSKELFGNWKKG